MQAITQHSIAVRPSAWREMFLNETFLYSESGLGHLGTVGLYRVVDVDQHQEYCHQQRHPARNYLGIYQKTEEKYFISHRPRDGLLQ